MKVILKASVPHVGEKDDVVDVAPGHARNYLFPQNLAVLATPDELARAEAAKAKRAQEAKESLVKAEHLAQKIEAEEIIIRAPASEGGALYGSISAIAIRDALRKKGYVVSDNAVSLATRIERAGEYEALVALPHGLEARLTVTVVPEGKSHTSKTPENVDTTKESRIKE